MKTAERQAEEQSQKLHSTEIDLATQKKMVVDLQVELQKAKEEVQLAKEAAEAEKKASYQLDVEETEIRLAEELLEVCRDYCDVTWDKALTVAEVPTNSILRRQEVSITIHISVRSLLPPLLLPLPQNLPSNLWQSQMPSLFLKFQRNPTKLVTKASGLREKKARKKTRGKSPLPRPKMQPE